MRGEIIAAAMIVASSVVGVRYWEHAAHSSEAAPGPSALVATPAPERAHTAYDAGWGEEVRVPASRDHQYYVTAEVNRTPAHFLIDTGASYVALRESDARLAGVYLAWTDFNRPVRTANGETKAAMVLLDSVEIEGLKIEGVTAFVLPDDQLGVNLLGMSFLSRLESVEARKGELVLRG